MNHQQALERQWTERYLLGELNEEERQEFEEHFFECPDCAEDVKVAAAFLDNARQAFAEDAAAASRGSASQNRSDRSETSDTEEGKVLPFPLGRFRPPPGLMAAAVAILVCGLAFQSLFVVPELQRELAEARSPQAVSWQFLSISRSSLPEVNASQAQPWIGFRLSLSSQTRFDEYRCDLVDADDRVVQTSVLPAPPEGEELGVVLPTFDLESGTYAVVLTGIDGSSGPSTDIPAVRYAFKLELTRQDASR